MKLINITKKYANNIIFENFSCVFDDNKITAILGPSGVGKSTLIKIINNTTAYEGEIVNPKGKGAIVYAEQRLLPNLTINNNLHYILKHVEKDKLIRNKIIENMLFELNIFDYKNLFPSELSTGIAQRVALARALLFPSNSLIMDEPFRGLDIGVRIKLIENFISVWNKNKKTVIWVTHDINEAVSIADKIIVLGKKPAEIIYETSISSSHENRNMNNEEIRVIYDKIINCFATNNVFLS